VGGGWGGGVGVWRPPPPPQTPKPPNPNPQSPIPIYCFIIMLNKEKIVFFILNNNKLCFILNMNTFYKENLIKSNSKLRNNDKTYLDNYNNNLYETYISLSTTNVYNFNTKAKDKYKDKDKINLEKTKLFSKFDKLYSKNKTNKEYINFNYNSFNFKKYNNIKEKLHPIINEFNNNNEFIFKNKFIRDKNKNKKINIQINIIGHEVSMNNILKSKKNKNTYHIIKDNINNNNNNINNKNKILNVLRIQTKSNFNNKYKLIFKSSNKKNRNLIQNYFSLIKKELRKDFESLSSEKIKNNTKKKVIRNRVELFNNISKTKIKPIPIPIVLNSDNKKKDIVINNIKNKSFNKSNYNNENNDLFSFYSTRNPIFQTELSNKKNIF